MLPTAEKPAKIGTEITVRISLSFQEAPDIHTLLAMTPVRERGKLVRLALKRYIIETAHPAGDVEQQINAISTWLRSRDKAEPGNAGAVRTAIVGIPRSAITKEITVREEAPSAEAAHPVTVSSDTRLSINRWLDS